MRSRGLVVAIAVVLAVLAAVGVIVYTNQVKTDAVAQDSTEVLVPDQDITTGTQLNPLIDSGVFNPVLVPNDALVDGAVTSVDQLRDQTTSAPVYANEQIPLSRLATGQSNNLGISKGNVGLGLEVEGPQAVNGFVQVGDHVAIFATFKAGTPVTKSEMKQLLTPAQLSKFFTAVTGAAGTTSSSATDVFVMPVDFSTTLVPAVKVLAIQNPTVDQTSGRQQSGASDLVLDLTPADALSVVYGTEKATLTLGLLPPDNDTGYPVGGQVGVPFGRVVGVNGK
jgi:Flp pilus assembly protein CpaB